MIVRRVGRVILFNPNMHAVCFRDRISDFLQPYFLVTDPDFGIRHFPVGREQGGNQGDKIFGDIGYGDYS